MLPADPNAAYDVNAAGTPINQGISASSATLLKELKPHPLAHITKNAEQVSHTSNFDWYRSNHKPPFAPKFEQDLFSLKADSTPGQCMEDVEGSGTSTMKYDSYSYKYNVNISYKDQIYKSRPFLRPDSKCYFSYKVKQGKGSFLCK